MTAERELIRELLSIVQDFATAGAARPYIDKQIAKADAYLATPEVDRWLPIETAPKDGRAVVLIRASNQAPATCRYSDREAEMPWIQERGGRCFAPDYFTHWMPPPAIPQPEKSP